jgi:cardiolipin synthase A/B
MSAGKRRNQYTVHNKVKLVRGGADYFRYIEEIADNAQYSLLLQTYIFDGDETGRMVAGALIRAAKRKVKVYVLLDGYASQKLPPEFIGEMVRAGIRFDFFSPFFKRRSFYIGRRLHHKIIVADATVCIVAGINISNRYNDVGDIKAWLDWGVYAEGEVARKINDICVKVWNRSVFRKKCTVVHPFPLQLPDEECLVRTRRNDWVYYTTQITRTYRELFRTARSHVILMTSYFWPPRQLLRHMAAASQRGVKVKLILTAMADVPLAKPAERYLYNWLFRNNIEVYEYQSNILHGKIAVCDSKWFTAGSYNVNNISAYASVELNVDVKNDTIATEVNDRLQQIIDRDCIRISVEEFAAKHNIFQRLLHYLSYRIVHFIFFLFTFYFIRKRENN